jgi:hypothetical protein
MGRVLVAWVAAVPLVACGPKVDGDGDSTGSTSTTTTSATATASSDPTAATRTTAASDDDGSDVSGYPDWGLQPGTCPVTEEFACPGGMDCSVVWTACGDPLSPFDLRGCLRPRCPCADDEVCFSPLEWGGCTSSGFFCEEDPNLGCQCGGTDDCGGRYCLPVDEVPAAPCVSFEDAPSCARANCLGHDGVQVHLDGGACSCVPGFGVCVPPLEDGTGPGLGVYFRLADPSYAVILPFTLDPVPLGLQACDDADPTEACACAVTLDFCP